MKQKVEINVRESDISSSLIDSIVSLIDLLDVQPGDVTFLGKSFLIKSRNKDITKEQLVFDENAESLVYKSLIANVMATNKKLKVHNVKYLEVWGLKQVKSNYTGFNKYTILVDDENYKDSDCSFIIEVIGINEKEKAEIVNRCSLSSSIGRVAQEDTRLSEELELLASSFKDKITKEELQRLGDIISRLRCMGC